MSDETSLLTDILDSLSEYADFFREKAYSAVIQFNRPFEVKLVYEELRRVRPKLSHKERMDLVIYHIKNETGFYKRVTEPIFQQN